jgi:tetratricopeptide (TPR) repeat protein
MKVFTVALLAIAVLCLCAAAQEMTADDWYKNGQELYKNESYQEALNAFDQVLKVDPENASAWHYKGMSLAGMGLGLEANQSIQKAMELIDQRLLEDPEDQEALWLRAEELDLLGRSDEALQAYDRVIDLNSSKALGAWIRKSDLFISLGRYNESAEAFDGALNLLSTDDKQSMMTMWWDRGTIVYYNAWMAGGQILRVTSGWLNRSSGRVENILLVNSDLAAAWQNPNKGKSLSSEGGPIGKSDEFPQVLSTNWAQYGFPKPGETAQLNVTERSYQGQSP